MILSTFLLATFSFQSHSKFQNNTLKNKQKGDFLLKSECSKYCWVSEFPHELSRTEEMQPIRNIPWVQTRTFHKTQYLPGLWSSLSEARHELTTQLIYSISAAERVQIIKYWSQKLQWRDCCLLELLKAQHSVCGVSCLMILRICNLFYMHG